MVQIPTPAQVALVRRRYVEGVAVRDILAETGIRLGMLRRCLDGEFPDGSGAKPAPIPRRHAGARSRYRAGSRASLVARLWRTAERQVEEIEERLRSAGIALAERESNARTLAILVRTLRELSAVEASIEPDREQNPSNDDSDDDAVPTDIDEFRQALARRIAALVGEREDSGSPGGPG